MVPKRSFKDTLRSLGVFARLGDNTQNGNCTHPCWGHPDFFVMFNLLKLYQFLCRMLGKYDHIPFIIYRKAQKFSVSSSSAAQDISMRGIFTAKTRSGTVRGLKDIAHASSSYVGFSTNVGPWWLGNKHVLSVFTSVTTVLLRTAGLNTNFFTLHACSFSLLNNGCVAAFNKQLQLTSVTWRT